MRCIVFPLLALLVGVFNAGILQAQTGFEQLEQQVRGAVGQPPAGQAAAGQPATGQEPGYVGLIADDRQTAGRGIRIMEIVVGGPAEQAGLKTGDLITGVDNQPIRSMDDFARIIGPSPAGTKLSIGIERDDKAQLLSIVLGKRPPAEQRRFQQFGQIPESVSAPAAEPRPGLLGVRIAAVTPELQQAFRLPSMAGALIVGVVQGTPADKAGIQPGAVVVTVDGKPVERPADLSRFVTETGPGRQLKLGFYQQGALVERQITLDAQPVVGDAPVAIQEPVTATPPVVIRSPASDDRVQQLQQRVEELERKVRELEQLLKKDAAPPTRSET